MRILFSVHNESVWRFVQERIKKSESFRYKTLLAKTYLVKASRRIASALLYLGEDSGRLQ